MGTLFRLLTLILCVELIVGPIQPNLSLMTNVAYATDCPTGFAYDSTLNRCLTKDETTTVINDTMGCAKLPSDQQSECYKNNAKASFVNNGSAPARKENQQFMSTVGNAAAIVGPVMAGVFGVSGKGVSTTCTSASFWAMVAGSAAFIIGDNLANFQHVSRLKKIREDWGKIVNPEGAGGDKDKEREQSIEAQSKAFAKLAEAEESMVKAAKLKQTLFTVAALAYTASGVIALLEIATESASMGTTKIGNICKATASASNEKPSLFKYYVQSEKPHFLDYKFHQNMESSTDLASFIVNKQAMNETYSSPSIDYYNELHTAFTKTEDKEIFQAFKDYMMLAVNNMSLIQNAHAEVNSNAAAQFKEDESKGINWLGLGLGAGIGIGVAIAFADKFTIETWQRATFAGVMAGWTMIMAAHAKSQAEASQKRADLLKKMEAEFKTAAGSVYACKSEDRNDPGKPSCYCYTPENGRNPNRTGSQICQKLWTGVDTKATNYNSKNASTRVCVTSQGKSDASCACKQTKTCMKVGINGLKGLNVGSMSMLSSALDPVNKITSGGDAATMDPGALANMAAKTQNLRNALENSKALAGYKKTKAKNESSMIASANKAGGSMNTAGTLGSSSSGMPSNPGEAARMLEKEVESEASPTGSKSGDTITAGGGDAPKEQLEFGLTQDDLANQENQIAEVMKENLDYGGNDTNPDAKANIFEVLSQRYQRSGMKRLFEEPAAAPTAAQPATAETIQK